MNEHLLDLLKILNDRYDSDIQKRIINCHIRALNWEETDRLPLVITYPYPSNCKFQPFPYSETLKDSEKMLYNELLYTFESSIYLHNVIKDDLPYNVRVNCGTVLVASTLGGVVEQRDNMYPWIRHLSAGENFNPCADNNAILDYVLRTYKFYNKVFSEYSNLKNIINIVLPDLQGPLDTLEQLKGGDIFLDMIMNSDGVKEDLNIISRKQVEIATMLFPYVSNLGNYSFQHNVMIKGNILIRDDSAVLIDSEMYSEFIKGCDSFVLSSLKGGGIHSCGKIDMNLHKIFEIDNLKCFDFGQSYLNDLNYAYSLSKEKKIPLLRLRLPKELLLSTELKKKFPTGVSLVYDAKSFEEACHISTQYTKIYGTNV